MKSFLVVAAALGGCAATYTDPVFPADHPASPDAQPAPPPPRSQALAPPPADHASPAAAREPAHHGEHGSLHETPPAPMDDAGAASVTYACPMHPEVTSDKPDQRCPRCNMKLKPGAESGGRQ